MITHYVISSKFHNSRVLSRHRSAEEAEKMRERIARTHAAECMCGGPVVCQLVARPDHSLYPIGYGVSLSEIVEVAP